MAKKPDPKMLGKGLARKAGEALKGRKSRIDDAVNSATGTKKKKQ